MKIFLTEALNGNQTGKVDKSDNIWINFLSSENTTKTKKQQAMVDKYFCNMYIRKWLFFPSASDD